ncbi:putative F-box/FBD/LRR-repeat protein [Nymphaea thermarum]|nr:putative F-box/FBD/LRR-repeat protein [Nymphaea thermarum]
METTFSAINKALSILNDSSSLSCVKVQISFEGWIGDNDFRKCLLELRNSSGGDAKPSVCRINSLPESILLHILSFLTFKDVVKCSVLSKKWRHLYTAIPVIDFGHVNFLIPFRVVTQQGFGHAEHQLQKPDFFTMVDQFLLSHDSYLRGFKLKVTLMNENEKNHLETWLRIVVDVKKVEELSLTVETPDQFYRLPLHLFNCTSVLHLMLGNCNFESRTDGMVMFPVLESLILHISTPAFDGGHFFRMLGECPQLKSLTIQGTSVAQAVFLHVSMSLFSSFEW